MKLSLGCCQYSLRTRVLGMGIIEMVVVSTLFIVSMCFTAIASEKISLNDTTVGIDLFGESTPDGYWKSIRNIFIAFGIINFVLIFVNGALIFGILKNKPKFFYPWFIYQSIHVVTSLVISTLLCVSNFNNGKDGMAVVSIAICVLVLSLAYKNVSTTYEYFKFVKSEYNLRPFRDCSFGRSTDYLTYS